MAPRTSEMTFLEHLEELRWRVVKCAIAVIVFAIPCGFFWRTVFDVVMIYPLRFADPKPTLIVTSPIEAVMLSIKIAIAGGIIFGSPVILYQIWRFVAPGLVKKEKVLVLPTVLAASLCFLLGVGFCYFMLPYMIGFLTRFARGRMAAMYRINEYLSFILQLTIAFGVVFELPVVCFVLTRLGIITPRFLIKHSRYAIVIIFIVAAILTPPDLLSQLVLAAPLLVLYAVSIGVSFLARGREKK
jgi:sec-independent protein translocase protein TatC